MTSAESAVWGIVNSRDGGLDMIFLHGPGESPVIRGDGKGVTSGRAIALSIGEDSAEPDTEALLPRLLAKTFLMLGVRDMPGFGVAMRENSPETRAVLLAVAAVTVQPGIISVWIRSPALKGLDRPVDVSRDV